METTPAILTLVMQVFTAILDWFGDAFATVTEIFWANNEATVLGIMAFVTFAVAIFTLVLNYVLSLIKGRG